MSILPVQKYLVYLTKMFVYIFLKTYSSSKWDEHFKERAVRQANHVTVFTYKKIKPE
jgi:hypothetical protein